jgi:peptidoglycan-N-acetylmuramic acid deacetylase PdaC-like protein/uncharacterized protein DUF3298
MAIFFPLKSELIGSYFVGEIDDKDMRMNINFEDDSVSVDLSIIDMITLKNLSGNFNHSNNTLSLLKSEIHFSLLGTYEDRKHELNGKLQLGTEEYDLNLHEVASVLCSEKKLNRLETKIEYPIFLMESDFLNQINKIQNNDLNTKSKEFFAEGLEYWLKTPEFFVGYSLFCQNEIEYYSENLISLLQTKYAYTGGAHGNTKFHVFNYYAQNDSIKTIKLDDLFLPEQDFITDLSNMCIKVLKQKNASYVVDGSINKISAEELQNFTFTMKSLNFHFEQYLMGCYAEGTFTVEISWQDLKKYMKKTELTKFFNK